MAVGAAGVAVILRLALDFLIGEELQPYIMVYLMTALVAWWGGLGPALVTLIVGVLSCLWIVVPPRNSLALRGLEDVVEILLCALVTVTIVFLVLLSQVTLRGKQQAETAREWLASAHRETCMILESISDAFTAIDREWRYTYVNGAAASLLRRKPEELLGKTLWDVWPQLNEVPFGIELRKALSETVSVRFEAFCAKPLDTWLEVRCYPSQKGLSLFFTDITLRKHAERMMSEAKEMLTKSNLELEQVVQERTAKLRETIGELQLVSHALVHDMRAPLRAMAGYAALLERECDPNTQPEAGELCKRIANGAERLDQLIRDSLSYTKSVQEDLPVKMVDLSRLLPSIIEMYPNLERYKGQIVIDGELPRVMGNEAGLTQCFANLLGNAVKFIEPGLQPRLNIWAENRGGCVRIWVEDNGIGIDKEYQERIFNMFEQVSRSFGGTGIGLAIVRKAVQRMGGSTGVESELGKGSRFWVELRRETAATKI
jgi:PAS domain S-box-containing protein